MANQPSKSTVRPQPATRPLWIIAISLATIAVCLVMIALRLHLDGKQVASETVEPESVVTRITENSPAERPVRRYHRPTPQRQEIPQPKGTVAFASDAAKTTSNVIGHGWSYNTVVGIGQGPVNEMGIMGRVLLNGTLPRGAPDTNQLASPCSGLTTNQAGNPDFRVGTDGGLADVIVSLSPVDHSRITGTGIGSKALTITNCQIRPYVQAVMVGTSLAVQSRDRQVHQLRMILPGNAAHARSEKTYTVKPGPTTILARFETTANFVEIRCDLHPWESAYVSVFKDMRVAVTDTNGVFLLPVPRPGEYFVQISHRGLAYTNQVTQEVHVAPGQWTSVNFKIEPPSALEPARQMAFRSGTEAGE